MTEPALRHGSVVAVGDAGLLILGASGSGKSSLALQMIALGATLVADDRVHITRPDEGPPLAAAPDRLVGLIEARGMGLLRVPHRRLVRLTTVVDLDQTETARLPERRSLDVLGWRLRLFHNVARDGFPAALMYYLKGESDTP